MKLQCPCIQCGSKGTIVKLPINDHNLYLGQGACGHDVNLWLQNSIYELLFESGMLALRDGYTREAVASLNCSLERFFEHCIYIFCQHLEISKEEVEVAWKKVSSQSERQLGAFYFSYLMVFKKTPFLLEQKFIEFRNKVIHKGIFPTEQETIEFAEAVANIIYDISSNIKLTCSEAEQKYTINRAFRDNKSNKSQSSTLYINTIIGSFNPSKKTLNDEFMQVKTLYLGSLRK